MSRIRKVCTPVLSKSLEEIVSYEDQSFPAVGYDERYDSDTVLNLSLHYHAEAEIILILEGEFTVSVMGKDTTLKKGEAIIIRPGVLHSANTETKAHLHSLLFLPSLFGGEEDDVRKKYITPFINDKSFTAEKLSKEETTCFEKAFLAMEEDNRLEEIEVRYNLAKLCASLGKNFNPALADTAPHSRDEDRIKAMISYLEKNAAFPLTVSDIAKIAGIGEKEATRIFLRTVKTTPAQYLLLTRISQSKALLLSSPSLSISEVAYKSGFESPSNYAMHFKKLTGKTPREWRTLNCKAE